MVSKVELEDIGRRMDAVVAAYLRDEASFDETKAQLASLWRELIADWPRSPGKARPFSGGEIHADQFYHFTAAADDQVDRAMEVVRAALLQAHAEISDRTA